MAGVVLDARPVGQLGRVRQHNRRILLDEEQSWLAAEETGMARTLAHICREGPPAVDIIS
jgi:hypothetical protein